MTQELALVDGTNVFIALVKREAVIVDPATQAYLLALRVGTFLKTVPIFIGTESGIPNSDDDPTPLRRVYIYNIGAARPVHIYTIPINSKLAKLNETVGAPFGTLPYFLSISLEWRGSNQTFSAVDSENVVIVNSKTPVTGAHARPDGDVETQKAILKSNEHNQRASRIAAVVDDYKRESQAVLNSISTSKTTWALIVLMGLGLFTMYTLKKSVS